MPELLVADVRNIPDVGHFHAWFCDPPYSYEAQLKRFGKPGSSPAKCGRDGAFARLGAGFLEQSWDDDVAFRVETWEAVGEHLYAGAVGLQFMSARKDYLLRSALEEAGFTLYENLLWLKGHGLPKPTRLAGYPGYGYGQQAIRPAYEPIVMAQKPHSMRSQRLGIEATGSGLLDLDRFRERDGKVVSTFFNAHAPECTGECVSGCPVASLPFGDRYPAVYWDFERIEQQLFYSSRDKFRHMGVSGDGGNFHPSVKPLELCVRLAAMLLPPAELTDGPRRILVPFCGSGTEVVAAMLAGWDEIVGFDITPEYIEIAQQRVAFWEPYTGICPPDELLDMVKVLR